MSNTINMASLRPNEHLAVLLPKSLWKPDSAAVHCDNFFCSLPFSIFERKHHCRKCGGIYCAACASRFTPLLDTSNLEFITPPRNIPITEFESPESPIVLARVCEDCYDQILGCPTIPRTPKIARPAFTRVLSRPIAIFRQFVPQSPTALRDCLSANLSPAEGRASKTRRRTQPLRHKPSSSSVETQSSSNSAPSRQTTRPSLLTERLPLPENMEKTFGELDAYPLRQSSLLCKATGGGRWQPKQSPVLDFYRVPVPGGKAPFEIEMERQEKLELIRRQNPVVKDGEFQYRFPKEAEPVEVSRSINRLSTF